MKSPWRLMFLLLSFGALFILFNYQSKVFNKIQQQQQQKSSTVKPPITVNKNVDGEVVICVVACGNDRLDESLTMLKSALVFSERPLRFIVISDYALIPAFHEKLTEWKQIVNKTFDFLVRPVNFPDTTDVTMWRKLFKPCAAQRLFLPVPPINQMSNSIKIYIIKSYKLYLIFLDSTKRHGCSIIR